VNSAESQENSKGATMRMIRILAFALVTMNLLAQTAEDSSKIAEASASSRLLGTWRLVSAGNISKDGKFEPFAEYGPHPIGYLMYDVTGHMCVSLANPNHPRWANPEKPTDAEKLVSYRVMYAYCGTYEVREKENRVIHRPEMASWPHYVGTDQSRPYRFEGNRLILSDHETAADGQPSAYQITWERVEKK
jgi:Lipocalin-like domain